MRIRIKNKRLVLVFRPISWIFRKDWYGLYRWKNPLSYENYRIYLIDFGLITFGYETNRK